MNFNHTHLTQTEPDPRHHHEAHRPHQETTGAPQRL